MKGIVILFSLFICLSCNHPENCSQVNLGLLPLGKIKLANMITVKNALEKYYGFNVVLLPETVLPPNAFTPVKSPRYRADSLLLYLQKIKPDSVNYIMGITKRKLTA